MSEPAAPDTERLRRLSALLETALALPREARGAWLQALPTEHRRLAPELESLLARADVETDSFLQRPLPDALQDVDAAEALELPEDGAGDVIGPYRLLRELGAGGMSNVWLAERVDGALQRQVALKLPRAGWAHGLAQCMARERDILAGLEHPRIARLYDAGVTREGRPWLAMEHVVGVPIDVHCREQRLDVAERLRLFLRVADAVAYAHARLVVHRDLKPSNILVTPEGDVRLLDFGVAKLLEDDGGVDLTQQVGRALTPDYASPEQVAGRPVTVATDIYSLGIVLYELLTGQRPYRLGRHSAAALEEAILAADVPRASVRAAGVPELARRLRGDIDTILAKAMRKHAALRYASVEALAADVQRHLDGEPVLAQRPSRGYRTWKFVRRHRLALATLGTVAASIAIGLGAALWQAREARLEAQRAEQVKRFIASIFEQAQPREGLGGAVTAGDLLDAAAQRIEAELAGDSRAAAELGVIVGQGFYSLGDSAKAAAPLLAALPRAERSYGPGHPVTLRAKALLVESLNYADLPLSERLLGELVPAALAGLPETAQDAVFGLRGQAYVRTLRNEPERALEALRQAIEIGERDLGPGHRDTIRAWGLLSGVHGRFGARGPQLEAATEAANRARAAWSARRPHATLAASERWYGEALTQNDRPADAVPLLARVLDEQRALDAAESGRVLRAALPLALAQAGTGRLDEAVARMREVVALEARLNPTDNEFRVFYGRPFVDVLLEARRVDEAWAWQQRMDSIALPHVVEVPVVALHRDIQRARLLALRGEAEAAEQLASATAARAGDRHAEWRARAFLAAAFNARLQRRPEAALAWARRVQADPGLGRHRLDVQAQAAAEVGLARLELGDASGAAPALRQALGLYEQAQVTPGPRTADASVGLARLLLQSGAAIEAEALLEPLVAAWERVHPGSEWHGEALVWLARAEAANGKLQSSVERRRAGLDMLAASRLPSTLALR